MLDLSLPSERLAHMDEGALLVLLDLSDGETLLKVWFPLVSELTGAGEAFIQRLAGRSEFPQLLRRPEGVVYRSADSVWQGSFYGRWLLAKARAAVEGAPEALDAYARLLAEASPPPVELALEAARLAQKSGEDKLAFDSATVAAKQSQDYTELQTVSRIFARLERVDALPPLPVVRVALLLTSAPQLIVPVLRAAGYAYGLHLEIFVPDFDTVDQVVYDAASALYEFKPEVVILGANFRALEADFPGTDSADWVAECAASVQQRWHTLSARLECRILQQTYDLPTRPADGHLSSSAPGLSGCIHTINAQLLDSAPPNVSFVDVGSIQTRGTGAAWSDDRLWHAARQHPAPGAIPGLVEEYLAIIRAYAGQTKKVIVLDLDGTLWGGVIGEDGLDGIQIGTESPTAEAFRAFQSYLLKLKQRGVLLAVCSKNNPEDAAEPFKAHDGMALRLDDFVAFKADWEPKHLKIRHMAEEMDLGLDSFVFVDDNPAERQLVRSQLPEVTVVDLPAEPADYIDALHRGRWFEALAVSEEDRYRSRTYRQAIQRTQARAEAKTLTEYLEGLDMEARSAPFDSQRLQRVAQLIQRTNQFNLTTRRHSREVLERMMDHPAYWTRWFSLRDRFGDHGITGLLIVRTGKEVWEIDTFLMSCRVIGRDFEKYMLNTLVASAVEASAVRVDGVYLKTAKNSLVGDFYLDHQFVPKEDGADRRLYSLDPAAYTPYRPAIRPVT